jgi:hypothetical protein
VPVTAPTVYDAALARLDINTFVTELLPRLDTSDMP